MKDDAGNAVADGTAVSWSFSDGAFGPGVPSAVRGGGSPTWELQTRSGRARVEFDLDRLPPQTTVTLVAGGAARSQFINGGPLSPRP